MTRSGSAAAGCVRSDSGAGWTSSMHRCGARASHHDRRLSWRRWRAAAEYRASAGKRKQDQSGKSTGARGCRVELGRHDGGERCRYTPLWQARAISGTRALMKRLLAILACARLTAASPEPIPHWTSYPARLRVAGWPDIAIIAASTILLLVVLDGVKRIELVSALGRRRPARA